MCQLALIIDFNDENYQKRAQWKQINFVSITPLHLTLLSSCSIRLQNAAMRIPAHIMAGRCLSTSRRLFSPSLPCKLSPAGPSFKPPYRSFHFSTSSSSSSPFNPFAVDTLDISRVQNTTLKEISENFARISIVEPPKTVSIVEPLESVIKISPGISII